LSICFVGLGANLGQAREAILAAILAIGQTPGLRVTDCSGMYLSAPVDAMGPDFLNAVIRLESTLSPTELLAALQRIEQAAGRSRPHRNAPRTLDLDLLLVDDIVLETPMLTLPHPRMHQRAFVLQPLIELAPELTIPGQGQARKLLDRCTDQKIARIGTIGPA
jgi:2-amino-4-hydroxy-6-hydroxymethyldihydropteridine diphosphokinase